MKCLLLKLLNVKYCNHVECDLHVGATRSVCVSQYVLESKVRNCFQPWFESSQNNSVVCVRVELVCIVQHVLS